jgi:hypothetical protein
MVSALVKYCIVRKYKGSTDLKGGVECCFNSCEVSEWYSLQTEVRAERI